MGDVIELSLYFAAMGLWVWLMSWAIIAARAQDREEEERRRGGNG